MASNDETFSRDEYIRHNIEAFLPHIIDSIKPTFLLNLSCYKKEHRHEIMDRWRTREREATRLAMDLLLHACDDQGRFAAFKDLMDTPDGYPAISALLEGKAILDDSQYSTLIQLFTPELINRLKPLEVLPYLLRYGTIDNEDCERIRAEEKNRGSIAACWVLLSCLPCRTENYFKEFMMSLMDSEFDDVAQILEPDMYEKMLAQRQHEAEMEPSANGKDDFDFDNFDYSTIEHVEVAVGDSEEKDDNDNDDLDFSSLLDVTELEFVTVETSMNKLTLDEAKEVNQQCEKTKVDSNEQTEVKEINVQSEETKVKVFMLDDEGAGFNENGVESNRKGVESDNKGEESNTKEAELNKKGAGKDKNGPMTYRKGQVNSRESVMDDKEPVTDEELNNVQNVETGLAANGYNYEQAGARPKQTKVKNNTKETGKVLRYDREFLLSLQYSPLANYVPQGISRYPEIVFKETNEQSKVNDVDVKDDMMEEVLNFEELLKIDKDSAREKFLPKLNNNNDIDIDVNNLDVLSGELPENYDYNQTWNILTDIDRVEDVVDDKDITDLREYQKELAEKGCQGENVVVMAPTNSGKTRVACKIVQEHLRRKRASGEIPRVIFLVENEALAFQQGEEFALQLPAYRTKVVTGSVQRDKNEYLKDYLNRRDIFVVTAQILVNALRDGEIDGITMFTMMVFDECHHTNNNHRYNELMKMYMKAKLEGRHLIQDLPQIVGLTASLGVGKKNDVRQAMAHMRMLLANHDAKYLCTVQKNKEELLRHTNCPVEALVKTAVRTEDRFRKAVCEVKDLIQVHMISHPSVQDLPECDKFILKYCNVSNSFGCEQFRHWLSDFKKAIAEVQSEDVRRVLNPCRRRLERYSQALQIHSDARILDALDILKNELDEDRETGNPTDEFLLQCYQDLTAQSFDNEPENPKLVRLGEIILQHLNNGEARGMIFVRTRELAKALVHWLNDRETLKHLKATEFVGQVVSAKQGGMTKRLQQDALKYFKDGQHKLIIATSVAEEGLDITKCNLVIRYEFVTNEIVRLQSRGRARAQHSHYYVVSGAGSPILAKEEKNAMLERLMMRIVPVLQADIEDNQNLWERDSLKIQMDIKAMDDREKDIHDREMAAGPMIIQCLNCSTVICTSEDLRKIQNSHHILINKEQADRLILARSPIPAYEEEDLQYDGQTFCGNAECRADIGGVCQYKSLEFPLLGIKNLRFVSQTGAGMSYKKWKKVPCYIAALSLPDLLAVVRERTENL